MAQSGNSNAGQVEDLATLSKLDEGVLLHELKTRYLHDRIYTYVGDILVAVNPFRDLGIYNNEWSHRYQMKKRNEEPPHIFAVADATYQSMLGLRGTQPKNQCILISGESGAGKTESTKLIIKQLIDLCKGNTQLEQQILQVNPLLEAFGNAQTLMNDNSSRFGKYIQLKFQDGHVLGAKISEYLLEKSRVVQQSHGEDNFHVFYYMFAGLTPEERDTYRLTDPKDYKYFSDGGSTVKKLGNRLKENYEELLNAMDMVGFTDQEQESMMHILAAVLTTGNIEIQANEDNEAVLHSTNQQLQIVASQLGVDIEEMASVLTCTVTYTRGEQIRRNYTREQSIDSRNAIAKAVYGRLFSWIVNKINTILAPRDTMDVNKAQEIGILDIFGFEHFERNSFEQACINLANEQLQFFFNKHIFTLEQEEYKKEGVDWKEIKFVDNQPLLDLFVGKPIGLMALLDEECQMPKGCDKSFVDKLNMRFDHDAHYTRDTHAGTCVFTISHYAGKVTYTAKGWLDKNRDTQPPGTLEMLRSSQNDLLSLIFKGKITRTGTLALHALSSKRTTRRAVQKAVRDTKERKLTVGAQFKNSLQVLMERMTTSQPVFIRCIKPNSTKAAKHFDDNYVEAQLLYTGMLETTKIRREGFAVRPTFDEFCKKYKILVRQPNLDANSQNCRRILENSRLTGWHVGKTKVFLKYYHTDQLAYLMEEVAKQAVVIQKGVRGFLARRRVMYLRQEAANQAQLLQQLLLQIEEYGLKFDDLQRDALNADKQIPRSFFDPNATSRKGTITSNHSYLEPIYQVEQPAPLDELPEEEVDGAEGDSQSEDEFEPVKTTGMTIYGEAGTRQASVRWFQATQCDRLKSPTGGFAEWFHGIITRRDAENLLQSKPVGCYLIRVSESRFGYSLSFMAEDRCRHYMIDQLPNNKFTVVGEAKVHGTLHKMVQYYSQKCLSNWDHVLTEPCGQETGQCDYSELLDNGELVYQEVDEVTRGGVYSVRRDIPPVVPPRPSHTLSTPVKPALSVSSSLASGPPLPERQYSLERGTAHNRPPPPLPTEGKTEPEPPRLIPREPSSRPPTRPPSSKAPPPPTSLPPPLPPHTATSQKSPPVPPHAKEHSPQSTCRGAAPLPPRHSRAAAPPPNSHPTEPTHSRYPEPLPPRSATQYSNRTSAPPPNSHPAEPTHSRYPEPLPPRNAAPHSNQSRASAPPPPLPPNNQGKAAAPPPPPGSSTSGQTHKPAASPQQKVYVPPEAYQTLIDAQKFALDDELAAAPKKKHGHKQDKPVSKQH